MNHYKAREIARDGAGTGRWHYTYENHGRIWPYGYCEGGCPGHDTPEEAEEHFRQFLVEKAVFYPELWKTTQRACAVCQAWTQGGAMYGIGHTHCVALCDQHRSREYLDPLVKTPKEIISSW